MKLTDAVPLGDLSPLAYVRRSRGLSQRELEHLSGVDGNLISEYERKRRVPSTWSRMRLALALEVEEQMLWPDLEPSSTIPVFAPQAA